MQMAFFYIYFEWQTMISGALQLVWLTCLPCNVDVEGLTFTLALSFHFCHFQWHILWCINLNIVHPCTISFFSSLSIYVLPHFQSCALSSHLCNTLVLSRRRHSSTLQTLRRCRDMVGKEFLRSSRARPNTAITTSWCSLVATIASPCIAISTHGPAMALLRLLVCFTILKMAQLAVLGCGGKAMSQQCKDATMARVTVESKWAMVARRLQRSLSTASEGGKEMGKRYMGAPYLG